MEIREYTRYDEAEILPLYESVGWTAYTDQPDALRKGFENSMLTLAAYEEERLIGGQFPGKHRLLPFYGLPGNVGNRLQWIYTGIGRLLEKFVLESFRKKQV